MVKILILLAVVLIQASATILSPEIEKAVLDHHNNLRRQEGASNMKEMKWDPTLAIQASAWSDACVWGHGRPQGIETNFKYVGQNLFMTTAKTLNATVGIDVFYKEKSSYDYETLSCSKVCGHYTQVVWANSEYLGCAVTYCPEFFFPKTNTTKSGTYLVCHYGPGGNVRGRKPFNKGPACSECPESYECRDGLCFKP